MLAAYAYVLISSYRLKTVDSLQSGLKTPTELSEDTGIRLNHMSGVLSGLKEHGVVECINEDEYRNRLYRLTDFGEEVLDLLVKDGAFTRVK